MPDTLAAAPLDASWCATALRSLGEGVLATDAQGRILLINPAATALTGWPEAEALGRPIAEVLRLDGTTAAGTARLRARDGRETPVAPAATPIRDPHGAVLGQIHVVRDLTLAQQAVALHQQLAAIVESSDDIIVSKTLDGVITSWNRGAERVLGYTAAEMIGQHVSRLMPAEQAEDFPLILDRIRRGERVDHYHTRRRRKDGTVVDVLLSVAPIRNAEGAIVGASKVGRDITEQTRAFELQERLAAIVESSDDIIVSKTLDGVITSWNRGAERVLGYTAAEMIGQHVSRLMPAEAAEDLNRILDRIRGGERVDHYHTRRRRKDGAIIDVALTVSPIRNAEGQIVGASKIGRDITREKQIEAERLETERRKDEFLAMLAHELRNPLSSISHAAQLLGALETEANLIWARDVVLRHVKHLARLIDDLLDVSRISRGQISLRTEPVTLSPLISNAVESVRPLLEQRRHELSLSLYNGGLQVLADPLRLEQILVNLLTNAAKYTDPGGQITVSARKEGANVVIRVQDDGIGMPPELLPRVFDLFAQGDRSIARSEGGLGIGLTLARKLAELHGGDVHAASAGVGRGSVFTVTLPALAPEPAPADPHRHPGHLPRVARPRSRVLVVDDHVDNALTLSRLLRLLGHDVRMAHDGPSALTVAHAHQPEVILLDIGLPGMDGYEVASRLRQDEHLAGALIVAISGYGQPDDLRRSRAAGFDQHLVKPVDYEALLTLFSLPPA